MPAQNTDFPFDCPSVRSADHGYRKSDQADVIAEQKSNDLNRREYLWSASFGLLTALTGCGTLLHEERVGQPRGGLDNVDWTVAGMNAIGLVFFFVPGVIAFAIDYYNGSLFYPPEHCGPTQNAQLIQLEISSDRISVAQIEETLKKELGIEASLHAQEVVVRRIPSIRKFWPTYREVTQLS